MAEKEKTITQQYNVVMGNLWRLHNAAMRFGVPKEQYEAMSGRGKAEQLANFQAAIDSAKIYDSGWPLPFSYIVHTKAINEHNKRLRMYEVGAETLNAIERDVEEERGKLSTEDQTFLDDRYYLYFQDPSFLEDPPPSKWRPQKPVDANPQDLGYFPAPAPAPAMQIPAQRSR